MTENKDNNVFSMRRMAQLIPVMSFAAVASLSRAHIVIENKFVDLMALMAVPYAQLWKAIRFVQFWLLVQMIAIIYLLYKVQQLQHLLRNL